VAVRLGLIDVKEVLALIAAKPENVHLILSGRNAHEDVIRVAHLVSEVRSVSTLTTRGSRRKKESTTNIALINAATYRKTARKAHATGVSAESPQEGGAPLPDELHSLGYPRRRKNGGKVRRCTAVQVHRTASHERSPPPGGAAEG